jgi:tryptophan-rich sensory protein
MNLVAALGFLGFLAACLLAASSGAIFRAGSWYDGLAKPWWRPPRWVFAPAWGVLYLLIATSGWLVWREAGLGGAALPLTVYFVSLAFNAAWSGLFFGLRRPDLAFLDVVALWVSIAATVAAFAPVSAAAAWLLIPYLCWVAFAAALNLAIWQMNRRKLGAAS